LSYFFYFFKKSLKIGLDSSKQVRYNIYVHILQQNMWINIIQKTKGEQKMTIRELLAIDLLTEEQKDMVNKILTLYPGEEKNLNIPLENFNAKEVEEHFKKSKTGFSKNIEIQPSEGIKSGALIQAGRDAACVSFGYVEDYNLRFNSLSITENAVKAIVNTASASEDCGEHDYIIKGKKLLHITENPALPANERIVHDAITLP